MSNDDQERQAAREGEKEWQIDVVYARPEEQTVLKVRLPAGATVAQALEASGIDRRHPELDLGGRNKVGVFGKVVKLDQALEDGDRVEVYRPLIADPKTARRKKKPADNAED